ncbi:Fic family protein [Frigidibacter sp. SD6-1]|uniref:Fic family protein n=1 Tax=Frigidibacter sp. SD6-1 TaxID=3032581 RepID=UPI0024E005B7|nr:Fic family protein [Frigidibacter sp. SD6-1]
MNLNEPDFSQAVHYHSGAFPPVTLDYQRLIPAIEDAAASLARYDAKMESMVSSALLLAPLRRQDAVVSSRMEGTISTIDEIYRLEAEEDAQTLDPYREARSDDIETFLYSRAMMRAQQAIEAGQSIDEHLIRSIHHVLLSFGRGMRKNPGQYKRDQNYVADDRRRVIHFVPISHVHLPQAMQSLVTYINDDRHRPLIRTALAHVEFEALHPFEDGNGRIGRMLITLMLWKLGILSRPHFFVSGYFETHKEEYVERMRNVSANGDWTGWTEFFLTALHEQARVNIAIADKILTLYGAMRERFRTVLNSQYHDQALDYVFGNPVFRNDRFVDRAGIPASSARGITRRLTEAGFLRTLEPSSGRRAALYAFDPLLDILQI